MQDNTLKLKDLTQARIALRKTGFALATQERLDFQIAHALARDAVHAKWDHELAKKQLNEVGRPSLLLHSQVSNRDEFLQKPHLGRRLHANSAQLLTQQYQGQSFDVVFCVSDGLSAIAITEHFIPLWKHLYPSLNQLQLKIPPVMFVPYGRVAVFDHIGELINAKKSVIFIGERPGLSAVNSLGIYFTSNPKIGNTDAQRRCISNIRPPFGASYREACEQLLTLIDEMPKKSIDTGSKYNM